VPKGCLIWLSAHESSAGVLVRSATCQYQNFEVSLSLQDRRSLGLTTSLSLCYASH